MIICLCLLVSAGLSFAQSPGGNDGTKWDKSYGAKLGLVVSNFTGDSYGEKDGPGIGFRLGGFMKYGTDEIAVQPEVSYVQKGDEFFGTSYLEFAGFFKVLNPLGNLWGDDKGKRMFYFGPALGVKLSSDISTANSMDFGFAAGFDAAWELKNKSDFILDFRFTFGLSEIVDNSDRKNLSLTLGLGMTFM